MELKELLAACERVVSGEKDSGGNWAVDYWARQIEVDGRTVVNYCCEVQQASHVADCCNLAPKLARLFLERLARDEAEAAERALPITEGYCIRKGARHWAAGREYVFDCGVRWAVTIADSATLRGGVYLDHTTDGYRSIPIREFPTIKTQGQLDDLLSALKGNQCTG